MPILAKEPDIYPEHLLDSLDGAAGSPAPLGVAAQTPSTSSLAAACSSLAPHPSSLIPNAPPWWALYTLPRREKELMRRLRALDLPFYCPIIEQRKRSPGGRVRKSYVPLFAGYVFLRGGEDARYRALTTRCVSRCLEAPNAAQLVEDLRQIRQLIRADVPLTPESRILPGARVRVRSGPLLGVEGVVVRRENQQRLLVAVRFLQQGASLLLDDFEVEEI